MAFVLGGALTHINTIGKVDELGKDDYYVFSAARVASTVSSISARRTWL
jgi:hypothetical protein